MSRLQAAKVGENTILSLIDAGAFDEFGINRITLRENLAQIRNYASIVQVEEADAIHFDFSLASRPRLMRYEEKPSKEPSAKRACMAFI